MLVRMLVRIVNSIIIVRLISYKNNFFYKIISKVTIDN